MGTIWHVWHHIFCQAAEKLIEILWVFQFQSVGQILSCQQLSCRNHGAPQQYMEIHRHKLSLRPTICDWNPLFSTLMERKFFLHPDTVFSSNMVSQELPPLSSSLRNVLYLAAKMNCCTIQDWMGQRSHPLLANSFSLGSCFLYPDAESSVYYSFHNRLWERVLWEHNSVPPKELPRGKKNRLPSLAVVEYR